MPITWDSDEIAYFVGFQVDLVEQPSAIMEKMRDGEFDSFRVRSYLLLTIFRPLRILHRQLLAQRQLDPGESRAPPRRAVW